MSIKFNPFTGNFDFVGTSGGGGGSGTVTFVALSLPVSLFSVSGSPVTTAGTLTGSLITQNPAKVFAGPISGPDAAPTFRALSSTDIPNLPASIITSGQGSFSTSTTGVTVTGTNAFLLPATVNIQNATTSQPGLLTSTDWNTFNNKMSKLLPANAQDVWVSMGGDDTNGDGTIGNPFHTITKALTVVIANSPSGNKPFVVRLMAGRYDYEPGNVLLPPWTWIVGATYHSGYIRINSGFIGLTSGWSAGGNRGGLANVYLGGGTNLNCDLNTIGGTGTPSAVIQLFNVWVTGTTLINGRSAGIDNAEIYNFVSFGNATFDSQSILCNSGQFEGNLVLSSSVANSNSQFFNSGIVGNTTITRTGSFTNTQQLSSTATLGTLSATGTGVTLLGDAISIPVASRLSVTGGAILTRVNDVTGLAFTPTVPGNWTTVPTTTQQALDTLAATGGGGGGVSSVALALPSIFSISGSPVTSTGTLTGSFNTQTANLVFAGPTGGGAATPTFRLLTAADIPAYTGNVDGGQANTIYGGILGINAGGA